MVAVKFDVTGDCRLCLRQTANVQRAGGLLGLVNISYYYYIVTLSYDDDDDVQGLLGLLTFSYYYMVTLSYDDYDVQGLDTISGFQLYGDMLSPKDQTKN